MARYAARPAVSLRREHGATERLTYGELDTMAAAAAANLAAAGVGPGDRCAILGENSARWCAVYLGILRLGAVAVPLDTTYDTDQIALLLRDCGAAVIVASRRCSPAAFGAAGEGCRRAQLDDIIEGDAAWEVPCPAAQGDAAVILYTSGTTADPKGVVLTHGNLLAEKTAALATVPVDERDTVLGVLPLFHALAQMANLLLPFSLGAHVVFLETLNTRELLGALREERVTVFCCVPQFFYLIHQRVVQDVARGGLVRRIAFRVLCALNRTTRALSVNLGPILFSRVHDTLGRHIRLLITGGAKFDAEIGQDLHAMGFTILQVYGLTETSGAAAVTRPGEPIATVGAALPGVEIRIDAPQPFFADGEVLIRGPIVMAGYWNRPESTAAVLRDGWLYTGDLGRLDEHGRLTITGRSKDVIVLPSGKNVYPEEIEAHYGRSPFIKEVCVIGADALDTPGTERLHAIVVPDQDALRERRIVNVVDLIRFELEGLSIILPGHKRVLGFDVSMQPLARTTTGKLKRHHIHAEFVRRASLAARSGTARAVPGPESDVPPHVLRVVRLIEELVTRPVVVHADSNFELDLGLDSMERVEMLAAVEQRLGVRVSDEAAQGVFTVRNLAEAIQRRDLMPAVQERGEWKTVLKEVGLSPAQQKLLLGRRTFAASVLFAAARLLRLLFRPSVSGIEHLPLRGPFILAPNHQSYLDPFALAGVIPFQIFARLFFVGATEYFQTPLTAWLASRLNIIPVDPDANLVPAMQAGAFGLRAGKVLVLFPEGERSIDGTVRRFKRGAGILAEHLNVPIVPVAIHGTFDLWPRNRSPAPARLLPWSGSRVRIAIGQPLAPADRNRLQEQVEQMWLGLDRQQP